MHTFKLKTKQEWKKQHYTYVMLHWPEMETFFVLFSGSFEMMWEEREKHYATMRHTYRRKERKNKKKWVIVKLIEITSKCSHPHKYHMNVNKFSFCMQIFGRIGVAREIMKKTQQRERKRVLQATNHWNISSQPIGRVRLCVSTLWLKGTFY